MIRMSPPVNTWSKTWQNLPSRSLITSPISAAIRTDPSSATMVCSTSVTARPRRGSPPKRRRVVTVWTWTAEILQEWVTEFRPLLAPPGTTALWPSERGTRIGLQRINSRFATYRDVNCMDGVRTKLSNVAA